MASRRRRAAKSPIRAYLIKTGFRLFVCGFFFAVLMLFKSFAPGAVSPVKKMLSHNTNLSPVFSAAREFWEKARPPLSPRDGGETNEAGGAAGLDDGDALPPADGDAFAPADGEWGAQTPADEGELPQE